MGRISAETSRESFGTHFFHQQVVLAHAWADEVYQAQTVGADWVFSPWPPISNWVAEPLKMLRDIHKAETIVFARPSHDRQVFPYELCDGAHAIAEKLGFIVLGDISYDPWDPLRHGALPPQVAALRPDV